MIRDLIDSECEPLSDKGIEIAPQAVAKYRDQLSVPTARMRKQF